MVLKRKQLSVSLNFRHIHNNENSLISCIRLWAHSLLVCLGLRPSVASILRQCIIPSSSSMISASTDDLDSIRKHIPPIATSPAYLIFCDGKQTLIVEKDHRTAVTRLSSDFISKTNHDHSQELTPQSQEKAARQALQTTGQIDYLEESVNRAECIEALWAKAQVRPPKRRTNGKLKVDQRTESKEITASSKAIRFEKIVRWVETWPITNEATHFACIMNPVKGTMDWIRWWTEPREEPDELL